MSDTAQQHESSDYKGPTHLAKYAWKPGQSGNPDGKKPGRTLTERVRALMKAEDDKGARVLDRLANAGIEAAERGEFPFWKYIYEIVDGPIAQKVEVEARTLVVKFEEDRREDDD